MKSRQPHNRSHPDAVEIELIRSLFLGFMPSSIISAGFIASGIIMYMRTGDAILLGLLFIWDQYHFVRQHYGFMRIYDAKNKTLATGSLDTTVLLWEVGNLGK